MDELDDAEREMLRWQMVREQIEERGVADPDVLMAMRGVPRHAFMPADLRDRAYDDGAFPIGDGQTISQPYIVGFMTELIHPEPWMHVLEIGTGSGYQTAVLARCVGSVDTIETNPRLSRAASRLFDALGLENVTTRIGDGFDGWPERAPYDAVLITAAPPRIPQPLIDQLAVGGRLVAPVGRETQDLVVIRKTPEGVRTRRVAPVMFVPMTGKAQMIGC